MDEKQPEHHHQLSTHRIEGLSDGIFAFAMTLLVLDLQFPDAAASSGISLSSLLFGQIPRFFNFLLSFVLLAVFWVIHTQQFHHIRKMDKLLLWINIGLLAAIVLIPFSASLEGDFEGQMLAELFFAGNMFLVGLFFLANWAYAVKGKHFTDRPLEEDFINSSLIASMTIPAVSLLAMLGALVFPRHSANIFLLIPLIMTVINWRSKRRRKA
ncbi:MAG: TMEM175 family protein [Candidatus Margulisiibacteriota bacterium]